MILNLAKNYFDYVCNRDLKRLVEMFADEITLRDWSVEAKGLKEVSKAYFEIFNSVKSISITATNLYQDQQVVVAEIDILIDGNEKIRVVDVLVFNEDNEIEAVRAYKA